MADTGKQGTETEYEKPEVEVFHTWWKAKTLGPGCNGVQGKTVYSLALGDKGEASPKGIWNLTSTVIWVWDAHTTCIE